MTDGDHAALLTIDLGALAANWRQLAARVAPAECAAAVKADAYGIGIARAGPALAAAGCRTFFVAHLAEARDLRAVVPEATIYVLNGFVRGTVPAYVAGRFRPVLGGIAEICDWRQEAEETGADAPPAALHVDTGMNRLGIEPDRIAEAAGLADFPVALLLSHYASSEVPGDPQNAAQDSAFAAARAAFPGIPASLANSSGIFLPGRRHFDMVRPGYALYGGNPVPGQANPMRPVVTLEAPVLQVRDVPAGTRVGYNGTWTARRPSRLATVSLGYADGWPRIGGGPERPQGAALVGGVICPLAGRVSMDLAVIDTTDAPPQAVKRGEVAAFVSAGLDIDAAAEAAGTIGYHLLTGLGRRYRRRYV